MTVKELIECLEKCEPNLNVVTGYDESNIDDVIERNVINKPDEDVVILY